MSGEEKRRRPAPSATPWDGAGDGELSPAERIVRDCHRDMYRYRHAGAGLVGEADFFNGYDRDACPRCGSPAIEGNGRDANGVRRWRCLSCGRAFNPATGTVFDGRKLPVADWTEFLLEVFSYGSLAGAARSGRRSATTPPYWLAKLLAVLEGVQEGAVLAGRVEIDEMMYPLPLADQPRMPDGSKVPGGFSKGKHCIGIGCDGSGAAVFADEGLGKTSGARTLAAFGAMWRAARRWSTTWRTATTAWSASWACAASGTTPSSSSACPTRRTRSPRSTGSAICCACSSTPTRGSTAPGSAATSTSSG